MIRDKIKSRRFFWRIFLHGLLLIAAVYALGTFIAVKFIVGPQYSRFASRVASIVAKEMKPGQAEQKTLKSKLDELSYLENSDIAVYAFDGRLIESSGQSRLPPLEEDEIREIREKRVLHFTEEADMAVIINTPEQNTYLIIKINDGNGLPQFVINLALIVLVIALMSFPLARMIARPLDKLTATARRIGQGDLSTRSGIVRKDEFGVLARTMDEMAEQMSQRMRSEKELLANVSHEIRTPLSRINVAIELCSEEDATEEEIKKYLDGVAGDLGELDRLLEDILITARLDLKNAGGGAGTFVLHQKSLDLGSVVSESRERFSRLHPSRSLNVKIGQNLPQVMVDPTLFRRVFDNLLDNAVKYSPQTSEIELEAIREVDKTAIEVRDRGDGIPVEDLKSVFDPFFRTDRSRSRGAGGTGLGLTLCKRIVEAHQGSIQALTRDGGGTTIRIVLG